MNKKNKKGISNELIKLIVIIVAFAIIGIAATYILRTYGII
jgi:hypothetical protein